METKLRKEIWPFLLRIFPWNSTYEHRDAIFNDLFLRYQRIKRNRIKKISKGETFYKNVESSILKDVIRTDRHNSFFAGDGNANLDNNCVSFVFFLFCVFVVCFNICFT
jgi:hypothetical protein